MTIRKPVATKTTTTTQSALASGVPPDQHHRGPEGASASARNPETATPTTGQTQTQVQQHQRQQERKKSSNVRANIEMESLEEQFSSDTRPLRLQNRRIGLPRQLGDDDGNADRNGNSNANGNSSSNSRRNRAGGISEGNANNETEQEAREALKEKHWKESPFAVGLVSVRWADDRIPLSELCCGSTGQMQRQFSDTGKTSICLSAYFCSCAGRVGNLVVCARRQEAYDHVTTDPETGQVTTMRKKRPRLLCVLGPYWWMNLFVTFPLIIGISYWTFETKADDEHIALVVIWASSVILMLLSLCMISFRNPGVMYRHNERPASAQVADADNWRWNDQAQTYRPTDARFDPECGVVIEGFDHTCPWTGTAIGEANMFWFRIFTTMVPASITLTIIIHVA